MATITITFRRRVQIVQYEDSVEYGVAVADETAHGESSEAAANRIQRFTAALFNAVQTSVLQDMDVLERRDAPLTLFQAPADAPTEMTPAVVVEVARPAKPPKRKP